MGELSLLLWLKSNLKERGLFGLVILGVTVYHGVEGLATGI